MIDVFAAWVGILLGPLFELLALVGSLLGA
jgi:hypothetical protein